MSKLAQETPQGQPQDVIGGGLSAGVVRQLIEREKLVSEGNKSKEHLLFFNSNGAWARMVSSVNTITETEANLLAVGEFTVEEVVGSKNLAYNNVLMGGTLKQGSPSDRTVLGGGINQELHDPIDVDSNGFIKAGDIKDSAYHKYQSLGYRPTPGIESVSVKSKGTYGTLREAEVNFKVWTLEDLEVMQALYLRPGYSILLEWGHSIQLQSSENVGKLNTQITTYKKFLRDNVDDPMLTFEKELLEITQQSDYNYDSFVGYVSNFNWSINEQGGYDCMVKVIAKGSVLESIACTFDPSEVYPADQMNPLKEDKGKEERKSIYHKFFTEMEYWKDGGLSSSELGKLRLARRRAGLPNGGKYMPIYTKDNFVRPSSLNFKNTLNDFAAFRLKDLELKDTGFFDNDNLNEYWIPLHVVLDIYNNYVTLIDGTKSKSKGTNSTGRKLTQFYTGNQDQVTSGVYEKKQKYVTTDQHFSINPMVCILPKRPDSTKLKDSQGNIIKWPDGRDSFPVGVVWKNGFHQQVESAFNQGLIRGETDDILNILISVQFLKDELDKIVRTDEDSDQNQNNNIVYFLRIILKAMNEAMGGVNDLDITYDDSDDLFYIVDRKVTPTLRNFIPTLSLSGVRSTMTNVNISSQISQNIGNMVSIAAQGTGGNSKDNVGPLLKWNAGLLDRHIRHKAQDKTDDNSKVTQKKEKRENPADKRLKQWIEDYFDYWREFNGDKIFDNGDFNPELVSAISNFHKKYCQKYVVEAYSKKKDDPKPPPGVVPVELSFSTLGIGGLKIGQTFKIEQGLLPQKYAEDFGYIITGLSHNIQDSKWTTDIKTQFYSLKTPTAEEIKYFEEASAAASEGYRPPAGAGSSPTAGGTVGPVIVDGEDPAPIVNVNRIGASSPENTPVFQRYGINLRNSTASDVVKLARKGDLVEIGDANSNPNNFASSMSTAKLLGGKYYLQKTAGQKALQWFDELKSNGVNFLISSAVRFGANTGGGAHGYGVALDFSKLYQAVGGSTNTNANLNARIQTTDYKTIAEIGRKYGWYNPWRLSDINGTLDELWHFEYWGPA